MKIKKRRARRAVVFDVSVSGVDRSSALSIEVRVKGRKVVTASRRANSGGTAKIRVKIRRRALRKSRRVVLRLTGRVPGGAAVTMNRSVAV
jgi:hypothetical protein